MFFLRCHFFDFWGLKNFGRRLTMASHLSPTFLLLVCRSPLPMSRGDGDRLPASALHTLCWAEGELPHPEPQEEIVEVEAEELDLEMDVEADELELEVEVDEAASFACFLEEAVDWTVPEPPSPAASITAQLAASAPAAPPTPPTPTLQAEPATSAAAGNPAKNIPWTLQENSILIERVTQNTDSRGRPNWAYVAKGLPGRSPQEARYRYRRITDAKVRRERGESFKNKCSTCGQPRRGHVCPGSPTAWQGTHDAI